MQVSGPRYADDYQLTIGGDELSLTYDELIAPASSRNIWSS